MLEDLEIIDVYSRENAITDGILIDLSSQFTITKRFFKHPVACTAAVWACIQKSSMDACLEDLILDLCFMASKGGIYGRPDPSTVLFRVTIGRKTHSFKAICGPDDNLAPCITIMALNED